MRRIYVASSWRCSYQPGIVALLRRYGHEVYDFRNPTAEGPIKLGARGAGRGFQWSEISEKWGEWTPEDFRQGLTHPLAEMGFQTDFDAMRWADTFVLVLPCGRSAHLELGWAIGAGKATAVLMLDPSEPELMYLMIDQLAVAIDELLGWLDPGFAEATGS